MIPPVMSSDVTGLNKTTVASHQANLNDRVAQRLDIIYGDKEDLPDKEDTSTGFSLNHSIKALHQNQMKPKQILYLNKDTGEYWIRAFIKDSNDEYTIPFDDQFVPPSIIHLDEIRPDNVNQKCKPMFYDNYIEYRIVDDSSEMPEFYKNEWSNPKTFRRKLNEDQIADFL